MFIPLEGDARIIAAYLVQRINELNAVERALQAEWSQFLSVYMAKHKLTQARFESERLGFEVPDADLD